MKLQAANPRLTENRVPLCRVRLMTDNHGCIRASTVNQVECDPCVWTDDDSLDPQPDNSPCDYAPRHAFTRSENSNHRITSRRFFNYRSPPLSSLPAPLGYWYIPPRRRDDRDLRPRNDRVFSSRARARARTVRYLTPLKLLGVETTRGQVKYQSHGA